MTQAGTQESDKPGPDGRGPEDDGGNGIPLLRIDGAEPLSPELVGRVTAFCDAADAAEAGAVLLELSGTPPTPWSGDLTIGLVSKWERALRRLERSPALTIAVASGDCGGVALDVLLAADHRIATAGTRLVPPVRDGLVWPGMALFRLAHHGPNSAVVRRAVLLGRPVEAVDSLALHLVHEIAPDLPGARAAAADLAGGVAVVDLALRRQLLFDAGYTGFEEALGMHLAACDRVLRRVPAEAGPA